jgi:hypothetical protein
MDDLRGDAAVGQHFTRWRDETRALSSALEAAASLGSVILTPEKALRLAVLLLEAEPPGTAAQQVRAGYLKGLKDAGRG